MLNFWWLVYIYHIGGLANSIPIYVTSWTHHNFDTIWEIRITLR